MFNVPSSAAAVLRASTIDSSVAVVLTSNKAVTAASAFNAVRTEAAHCAGVCPAATATSMVLGDPIMPAAVTTTLASPLVAIAPAAVAVSTCLAAATPPVVFVEVGGFESPMVLAPLTGLSSKIFKVASFAAVVLRVSSIDASVAVVLTSNKAVTAASAFNAVRTEAAHCTGVCPAVTATLMVLGDPVIPAAATTTLALPLVVIVPAAVAVSTCLTVPAIPAVVLAELGAGVIPMALEL